MVYGRMVGFKRQSNFFECFSALYISIAGIADLRQYG
jgi:hypothetical protein